MNLKQRLQIALLFVALLCILLTGWESFHYSRDTIEAITFARLTGIRETKKRQIESYFHQIRNHIVTLAEDRATCQAVIAFRKCFPTPVTAPMPGMIGSTVEPFRAGSTAMRGAETDAYVRARAAYHPAFARFARRFRYSDLLLADAATGDILYAVSGHRSLGSSFGSGRANIARAFALANVANSAEFSCLVDFAPYEAMDSLPAAFVASPVFDGPRRVGVLLFALSIGDINEVMTSGAKWEEEGLGKTGETYIVGDDFTMRNDSRFFVQDSASYFRSIQQTGTHDSTLALIRSHATTILIQQVKTEATTQALLGNTSTRLVRDYRGIEVLSSYTPLNIPGVHWVMLAEIDAQEALSSVASLRERLVFAGLALLLLASAVGFVLARMISRPLVALTSATERFGKGDGFHPVPNTKPDEIGLLTRTFNRMAETMTENTARLQKEIHERTRAELELRTSREELRSLSSHLQSVREEERQGVARDIHDELGQALSALKLDLSLMKEDLHGSATDAERRIVSMSGLCDTTIKAVRRIISQLRPHLLDDLGLTAAIEWQAEEFQQRTGITCSLTIVPAEITLDAPRSTAIFRIFQETLTNVARHSGASAVTVQLRLDNTGIILNVDDNGRGISDLQLHDSRSFGLLGVRERAHYWGGTVSITGEPARGTHVSVFLPGDFTTG